MLMLFSVDARHHGSGPVKYTWDPHGKHVASTGSSRVAHIFGRRGKLVDQVVPPSPRYGNRMLDRSTGSCNVHRTPARVGTVLY